MGMQEEFDKIIKNARQETLSKSDQLSLGDLIKKIEPIAKRESEQDENIEVYYDFEYFHPTGVDSWRGSYSELALNITHSGHVMSAKSFLNMLKDSIGAVFTGWKGGDFYMSEDTPLWVGISGNTAIVGVLDEGYKIVLLTGYREF